MIASIYDMAAALAPIMVLLFIKLSLAELTNANVSEPATLPVVSFCTGGRFACAAFNNNKIKCWGDQLSWGLSSKTIYDGQGDIPDELASNLTYVPISDGSSLIEKIYCGGYHFCVRFQSGSLKCIGSNYQGQTGSGLSNKIIGETSGHINNDVIAVNFGTGLKALDASLGGSYSCAIVTGNKVKCYGNNYDGQLGYGDTVNRGRSSDDLGNNLTFVDLGTGVEVAYLYSGLASRHNCAILSKPTNSAQRIKCWGANDMYQLGYGDFNHRGDEIYEMGDNLTLVDLGTESRVKQVVMGTQNTCFLLLNDGLKCIGLNSNGQLGIGSQDPLSSTGNAIPLVLVDSGKAIKQLTSGSIHTCILYSDNLTGKCIGYNYFGQLGQGDKVDRGISPNSLFPNFTAIDFGTGLKKIASLHSGENFNCILLENSLIKCWGNGYKGQLGIGSNVNVGDQGNEMGTNLQYSLLFGPTQSPTKSPTKSPTPPTKSPTKSPTTSSPTKETKSDGFANHKQSTYVVSLLMTLVVNVLVA